MIPHPILASFLPAVRSYPVCPDAASRELARRICGEERHLCTEHAGEVLPLLAAAHWRCDLAIVAAPTLNSQLSTLNSLFPLLSDRGELLALFTRDQERALFGDLTIPAYHRASATPSSPSALSPQPSALHRHIWLRLVHADTVALYLAKSHTGDLPRTLDLAHLADADLADHARRRVIYREGPSILDGYELQKDTLGGFKAAITEHDRRTGKALFVRDEHPFNLWLEDGKVKVWLDGWQQRVIAGGSRVQPGAWHPLALIREVQDCTPAEIATHGSYVEIVDGSWDESQGSGSADSAIQNSKFKIQNPSVALRIEPALLAAVHTAVSRALRDSAPYYELGPAQRIAWLDRHRTLRCTADLGPFRAGRDYPVKVATGLFAKSHTRPSMLGPDEDTTHHSHEIVVTVSCPGRLPFDKSANGGTSHLSTLNSQLSTSSLVPIPHDFHAGQGRMRTDKRYYSSEEIKRVHSLDELAAHFAIPEVPSVVQMDPAGYARQLAAVDALIAETQRRCPDFRSFEFQRDDLARFTLHPGGVFAWDKGGGKTVALYLIPMLYGARRTLIVAPEGLHEQIIENWQRFFGITPRTVMSIADIDRDPELKRAVLQQREGGYRIGDTGNRIEEASGCAEGHGVTHNLASMPPGEAADCTSQLSTLNSQRLFWITSYNALGYNGADEWVDDLDKVTGQKLISPKTERSRRALGVVEGIHDQNIGQELRIGGNSATLGCQPSPRDASQLSTLNSQPPRSIRCLLTPSLATVLREVFDCVECDEAVRIKSEDSYMSLGVRRLLTAHPVALTGTPVKNRLEDIFRLAHWTAGSPATGNARFPYADQSQAREHFADRFMVTEENHTKAAAYARQHGGKRKTFKKRIPILANVQELWRALAGIVLRRRKEDFGTAIVPKTIVPVKVKLGTRQREVYRHHLQHAPEITTEGKPIENDVARLLAQINCLRQAAQSPDSPNLRGNPNLEIRNPKQPRGAAAKLPPTSQPSTLNSQLAAPSPQSLLTPLMHGCLQIITERLNAGKQIVIATPFQHFGTVLQARCVEAGVSSVQLDGRTSPAERGLLARKFKQHEYSVLIAGQASMGEGHSFEQCDALVMTSLDWAYDINSQMEDRVHRLTSPLPVTIYVLTPEGTIAERLLDLYREKGDSANLALDGRLFADRGEEVSLGALLRDAAGAFHDDTATIDEAQLERDWPAFRARLHQAEQRYREWHPPIVPDRDGKKVTPAEIRAAQEAIQNPSFKIQNSPSLHALPAATETDRLLNIINRLK